MQPEPQSLFGAVDRALGKRRRQAGGKRRHGLILPGPPSDARQKVGVVRHGKRSCRRGTSASALTTHVGRGGPVGGGLARIPNPSGADAPTTDQESRSAGPRAARSVTVNDLTIHANW
ncbi:hypothetical protein GCM10017556_51800 [Micromonospora sagamiensis]|nr:hypothetical protein GCM10017556_51800 [Micromonospora sagamiensis]